MAYSHEMPAGISSYFASLTAAPFGVSPVATTATVTVSVSPTPTSRVELSTSSTSTTLQTTSSSTLTPISKTATSFSANNTADADLVQQNDNPSSGMPAGTVAALVVAVVLALVVLAAAFFFVFVRRRRRRAAIVEESASPPPPMQESAAEDGPLIPHIITASSNNAYYTGLDTMSEAGTEYRRPVQSDAGSYLDPPPPYKPKGRPSSVSTIGNVLSGAPPVRLPTGLPEIVPFPMTRGSSFEEVYLNPGGDLSRSASRQGSRRSIDSDAYSENASVHSARVSRMPSPVLTMGKASSTRRDPFEDPDSPTSRYSVASQSWTFRSRNSSPISRVSRS